MLLQAVKAAVGSHQRFVVALSGGVDSMVLLHVMCVLVADQPNCTVRAIYVNHHLQAESDAWADFCASQCRAWQVPFASLSVDCTKQTGESQEAVARRQRYAALAEDCAPDEVLLTAHHADDQVETFFLRLLRGAGLCGLAGILPERWVEGSADSVLVCRPLLQVGRAAIVTYANTHQLAWITDPSNNDTQYDRNYVRHEVMPQLKTRWPGLAAMVQRLQSQFDAQLTLNHVWADQWLADVSAPGGGPCERPDLPATLLSYQALFDRVQQNAARASVPRLYCDKLLLTIDAFASRAEESTVQLKRTALELALRRWLARENVLPPSTEQMMQVIDGCVYAASDATPLVTWGGVSVRRYRQCLYLYKNDDAGGSCIETVTVAEAESDAFLHYATEVGCLQLTGKGQAQLSRTQALTIRFDAEGASLKKQFQSLGVPTWLRGGVPQVFQNDQRLGMLWLSGG